MLKQKVQIKSNVIYSNVDTISNKSDVIKAYIEENNIDFAVFTEILLKTQISKLLSLMRMKIKSQTG